jgi:hypothetical protein
MVIAPHTNYWYFRFTLRTYYLIANCIFYGGLGTTALLSLLSLTGSPHLFPIFLIGGSILSIIGALGFGFVADFVQWLLNIEANFAQMKNRLNQND